MNIITLHKRVLRYVLLEGNGSLDVAWKPQVCPSRVRLGKEHETAAQSASRRKR